MIKIYSKVYPEMLLHLIVRQEDFPKNGRIDLIAESQFIQCSALNMNAGKTFKPHKHIWKSAGAREVIAQESWVVIKGKVMCHFYDIDDIGIGNFILNPGDASFTLRGGHNYSILEDGTIVYEYKTGPYEGQELDKKFI